MLITWNEDLRTGDDQIDHQHMYLIEQTNRLYELAANGVSPDECERIVTKLLKYVQKHFSAEENLMGELAYPGVSEHRQAHQSFTAKVNAYYVRIKNGETLTPETVKYLLADWFENHIRKYDLDLARYSKKSRVSR